MSLKRHCDECEVMLPGEQKPRDYVWKTSKHEYKINISMYADNSQSDLCDGCRKIVVARAMGLG